MEDFTINEMRLMQKTLQEKYKDIWEGISPSVGKTKLLWLVSELGEVADVVKKNGEEKIMGDGFARARLVEELADVLMYYNDVLDCYGVTTQELKNAYVAKFEKNMKRW